MNDKNVNRGSASTQHREIGYYRVHLTYRKMVVTLNYQVEPEKRIYFAPHTPLMNLVIDQGASNFLLHNEKSVEKDAE